MITIEAGRLTGMLIALSVGCFLLGYLHAKGIGKYE